MKKSIKRIAILVLLITLTLIPTNAYAAVIPAKPTTPALTQDITAQTESVTVTISNWGDAVTKEYRINEGEWQSYNSPVILKDNALIEARGKNKSGAFSDIAKLEVKNIRKLLSKTEVSSQSVSTVKVIYYDINDIEIGNGSGFIISSDGQVVTNYHVIDMVPKLKVVASDGKEYDVLGVTAYNVNYDLAVLKLKNADNMPAVKLGNSDDLKLGEEVVAIGYPLGLQVTVTFGNVSSLNTPGGLYRTNQKDIQITSPISAGNSGGPLFNMYGEVVGINYSTIINAQNMNYSIPINQLKPMISSKSIKSLSDVIREVYPTMTYPQYSSYLFFNLTDTKSGEYLFSITDVYALEPEEYPNELNIFLSLNPLKYAEILMAEFEGNKQLVEKWLDTIYKSAKAKYPNKEIYIVVALDWSFNTRPEGYTDKEVYYNTDTRRWEVYRVKIVYGYKNNAPAVIWF